MERQATDLEKMKNTYLIKDFNSEYVKTFTIQ